MFTIAQLANGYLWSTPIAFLLVYCALAVTLGFSFFFAPVRSLFLCLTMGSVVVISAGEGSASWLAWPLMLIELVCFWALAKTTFVNFFSANAPYDSFWRVLVQLGLPKRTHQQ